MDTEQAVDYIKCAKELNELSSLLMQQATSEKKRLKNKISFSSFVIPIEYRWRRSSIDQYKFWRIYTGLKIKKNFPLYSNPSYGSEITIDEIEDWTTSIYLNAGYNTWNVSLEYDLNPILKNKKTSNGENLNISFFRLGLVFYIL